MIKKRGKSSRVISKSNVKKVKASKVSAEKSPVDLKPMEEALHQLEILAEEKKVENKVNNAEKNGGEIERKEKEIEKKEEAIIPEENKIEKEIEKIEKSEKEIKKEVAPRPLTKFNAKDLNKGIIGAFIGAVAYFAFIAGKEVAENIDIKSAITMIIFSYLLVIVIMYETGQREVKEKGFFSLLPTRAAVAFLTYVIIFVTILFLFNHVNLSALSGLYKQIGVASLLSSLGLSIAYLIGRE